MCCSCVYGQEVKFKSESQHHNLLANVTSCSAPRFLLKVSKKTKIRHISQLEVLSTLTLTDDTSECLEISVLMGWDPSSCKY